MTGKGAKGNQGAITNYLLRSKTKGTEHSQVAEETGTEENLVQDNMADPESGVSNAEILKRIINLDSNVTTGFQEVKETLGGLKDKVEELEHDVGLVKDKQVQDQKHIESLEKQVEEMRRSLLLSQLHGRKMNLVIYGVAGHEGTPEETIEKVRSFAVDSLKLKKEFADNMLIRNAHRLQKRQSGDPATIIVVFVKWTEREEFLKSGKNLKGTTMSVRVDMPPELKKKRGILATEVKELIQNDDMQARIRNKGIDFWIEVRRDSGFPWKRQYPLGLPPSEASSSEI